MAASNCGDKPFILNVQNRIQQLTASRKLNVVDQDELTNLLDEFIIYLNENRKKESDLQVFSQELLDAATKLMNIVQPKESFKVVKVCQVWERVVQLPGVTITNSIVEQFWRWIIQALQLYNKGIIFTDILNCVSAVIRHKEIKQAKAAEQVLGATGYLTEKFEEMVKAEEVAVELLAILEVLCNFTLCQGEKDWSSISKEPVKNCIHAFCRFLEQKSTKSNTDIRLLKAFIHCFHGLENVFVRFHVTAIPHIGQILGLCKCYMLLGVPGHTLQYNPILPSPVPFMEQPAKSDSGRTPNLRKKKPLKNATKNRSTVVKSDHQLEMDCGNYFHASKIKSGKAASGASSSDSELSDSDGESLLRQREYQAKVRAAALKTLTAAFKFCDQRTVISYWSAFLPDASQGHVFRHSLMTPILKDSSPKVRCKALNALSTLLQAIQPTVAMANYQENRSGSFIPFSQTLAEMAVTVQRSLLLVLSAEQSNAAFIQLFKCLTVAASVFPYEKLPSELVPKSVKQCTPFLEFKDPDVRVACLSLLRTLLCTHSSNPEVIKVFWDSISKTCWLLEHCLSLIQIHSGFPLTLESLLVLGEVSRTNIQLAQPYLKTIIRGICQKLQNDNDPGIQIRCAKALALVCCSILQEMEKEDGGQIITRDEAVQMWIYILRHGLPEALQSGTSTPLRAEACAALATVGSQIFECLPRDLRIMFATMALGCANDPDSGVRAAAIRTLGFAVTFNTLSDDASFILDSSEIILSLLKDVNVLVNLNSSWALGNLAETLEKNKNLLEEELPTRFLMDLIQAGCQAAQGPIKVRGNAVRALGIFLKLVTEVPAEGSDTAVLLDQAISIVVKQVTTGNFMKNRWNACYAVGNIFQNVGLLTAFSHWMEKLLDCLLQVFRSCPNYKVRISAASAMLHFNSRLLLSTHYIRIWSTLLESLASSEQIEHFAEYQHHERFEAQTCNTLCKLVTLMTKEDLSSLNEVLVKYYDVCAQCFEKFLKSLLPDQLELMLEASSYVQQLKVLGQHTPNQQSALDLVTELLRVPC